MGEKGVFIFMKPQLFLTVIALVLGSFCGGLAWAEPQSSGPAAAGPAGAGRQGGMLSFLNEEDKAKLLKAREDVLAKNPQLKAEQDNLKKQREDLKNDGNATQEDRMALFQDYMAHEQKMKVALLKADPSLAPILDKIDQQMKQKMQQRAGEGAASGK